MTSANDPWGRVDPDGTVYVRTAEGERVIGSWQAGSPEEALAFYQRKFASLDTEVSLLEQRITTTDLSPAQARGAIDSIIFKPGLYLLRLETIGAAVGPDGHEYFATAEIGVKP